MRSGTPEDQLLLQFQGMIAEYERAQILECSWRGKRYRAKEGEVSGAPYGYRYIRKNDETAACSAIAPALLYLLHPCRRMKLSKAKRMSCAKSSTCMRWKV
jgi:DNA invertase Pin-like site-specific DNA recombinase